MKRILSLLIFTAFFVSAVSAATLNELRLMGYSLIPEPQKMELSGASATADLDNWAISCSLGKDDICCRTLIDGLKNYHQVDAADNGVTGFISLSVDKNAVGGIRDESLSREAYRLTVAPSGKIEIVGNSEAGLLYGVESLLQLARADKSGKFTLPVGMITDWPATPLRVIHWDTKHHQSRMETLKRYLDQAAYYKVNAVAFELEDKFEYPSHPIIGAPGAYTTAEMQELTRYALERNIQMIPDVQAPAHMAFVLKHEEFSHLRSDGSNFQICMCDPEAMELIFDMYQDMIDATPGVEYFHVSTDEVYYAGICDKCKREYNEVNRSLAWVEYVNKVHEWMTKRDRKVICWVEYPLIDEHIKMLPEGLIDGITTPGRSQSWVMAEKKAGIRQLVYSSQQGSEYLFPNVFDTDYRGRSIDGRVEEPVNAVKFSFDRGLVPYGTFAAAWDDAGLNDETFWLGWAAVTQYGWSPQGPSAEQTVADFMDTFYGPGNQDMVDNYKLLQKGARFFEASFDQRPETELKEAYGNPYGPGRNTTRIKRTLDPPQLPFAWDMYMVVQPTFSRTYGGLIEEARSLKPELDQLIQNLNGKLQIGNRQKYNVEVFISIAELERHWVEEILALERVENQLVAAEKASMNINDFISVNHAEAATAQLMAAYGTVSGILAERKAVFQRLTEVWEKGRFEKGRSVDGRKFVHILDDLKDHFADRRAGLDYMLVPMENLGLEQWNKDLARFIKRYAESHGIETKGLFDASVISDG